jgi:hypothetical protein
VRTRTQLELEAKESELRAARQQLAAAVASRQADVTEAKTAAEAAWRAEVGPAWGRRGCCAAAGPAGEVCCRRPGMGHEA